MVNRACGNVLLGVSTTYQCSSVTLRELALWLLSQRQPTVLLLISCFLEHTGRAVDTESRAFAGAWRARCYQQTGTEQVLVSGPGAHSRRRIGLDLSFCRDEKQVPFLVPASLCCAELAVAKFLLCAKLPLYVTCPVCHLLHVLSLSHFSSGLIILHPGDCWTARDILKGIFSHLCYLFFVYFFRGYLLYIIFFFHTE